MTRAVLTREGDLGRVLGWVTGCLEPIFCPVAPWTGLEKELTKNGLFAT